MLLGTVVKVLASASVAFGHVVRRNESAALDALEHAAFSRLPNVPLPDQISNSTIKILQLMTIFLEFDAATYTGVLDSIARNMTGYTDFSVWTKEEVVGILQRHQAVSVLKPIMTSEDRTGPLANRFTHAVHRPHPQLHNKPSRTLPSLPNTPSMHLLQPHIRHRPRQRPPRHRANKHAPH